MSNRQAEQQGLVPVDARDFVLSALTVKNGTRSVRQFVGDLKAYADTDRLEAAFEELVQAGWAEVNASRKAVLTAEGRHEAERRFGKLAGGQEGLKRLKNVVWPALALGMEPNTKGGARLARPEHLRAALLVSLFRLPLDKDSATLSAAVSALVLRGMAGASLQSSEHSELKPIVQNAGDLSDADKLRQTVVRAALALGARGTTQPDAGATPTRVDAAFASNVQVLADKLSTPPFSNKVAIAQVYDAYGREHRDAGSLDTFKEKLLAAHKKGLLKLRALDEPQAMDQELRERSLIKTRYGWYYFVARG